MAKKDETKPKKVLGTGAHGDPEHPELGAPNAVPVTVEPVEPPHTLDHLKESK